MQPGKGARPIHATTRAVEEAKYVLTRAIRPVTAVDRVVAAADALGDSLPLHERGEARSIDDHAALIARASVSKLWHPTAMPFD